MEKRKKVTFKRKTEEQQQEQDKTLLVETLKMEWLTKANR